MNVLDKVYNTFSNLDRDFARSKKTRTAFITDKFGGDIDTGAMIILDAVSTSGELETAEDIKKLTFVKDIFSQLQANKNKLDSLQSFSSFSDSTEFNELMRVLAKAESSGTGQRETVQAEVYRQQRRAVHFVCTAEGSYFVGLNDCKILHAYNGHMQRMIIRSVTLDNPPNFGDYLEMRSKARAVPIAATKVPQALK